MSVSADPDPESPTRERLGTELGRQLVLRLASMAIFCRPVVIAVAATGMPAAGAIARQVAGDLDLMIVGHIDAPGRPGDRIGALTAEGPPVFDADAVDGLHFTEADLTGPVAAARARANQDQQSYHDQHPAPAVGGHVVVLFDERPVTGMTACAALRRIRSARPSRLIMAAPRCPDRARALITRLADDIVVCPAG
jgi:putative phosphoribosyl transferase